MNTDIFASLLLENEEEAVEKFLKSDEMQSQIELGSTVAAIMHVLVKSGLVTEENFEKIKNAYRGLAEKKAKEVYFEQLKKIKEEE